MAALDTRLTPELEQEGLARELVHHIQGVRRDADLSLTDRITIAVAAPGGLLADVIARHGDHIARETIADRIHAGTPPAAAHTADLSINGQTVRIGIVRISRPAPGR